jgi:hexosaminidase
VIEPVKDYTREETALEEPTSQSPLNKIVDAIPLESDAGRQFSERVDKFLATGCKDASAANVLRTQLTQWSQNDAAFSTLAQKSALAKQAAATSADLSAAANTGLAALDAIAKSTPLTPDQQSQLNATLSAAAKPKAQLLLIPVPAINKLLAAASQPTVCK